MAKQLEENLPPNSEALQGGPCLVPIALAAVLRIQSRIRIRWISKFLGPLVPDTDPLVRGTDPDPAPDPALIKQK